MATIRDPNPIKLGEFHTVELYRNHTLGYIIVDGGEPINGSSQVLLSMRTTTFTCAFQFSYVRNMFNTCAIPFRRASSRAWISMRSCMWAVTPTTQPLPKLLALRLVLLVRHRLVYAKTGSLGWRKSLVLIRYCCSAGCIRQLIIQGDEVIFKDLDRSSTGVTNCPTCKDQPCQVSCIHPLNAYVIFGLCVTFNSQLIFSLSLFRTEELVRTRTPACISAAAPEDSQAATASTTHPCTATQVRAPPGHSDISPWMSLFTQLQYTYLFS